MADDLKLPTDTFDKTLARLTGLPDGAQTLPAMVQSTDFYGNTTSFMVQTVRWEKGNTVFVTHVNAAGSQRYALPPEVTRLIDRQAGAITQQLRSRQGKRLAAQARLDGRTPMFTPEMRQKAIATRKAKAAKKAARKARKA
jgi:hypothetical protein